MKKILVIDDDKTMLKIIEKKLHDFYDLKVTFCRSYIEAMAEIASENYDLFILDYQLDHGRNGFEILEVLKRKMNISNRVIMFSATHDEELMINAYGLGVSNFFKKPLKINLFGAVLKKNLRMLESKVEKSILLNGMRLEFALQSCYEIHEKDEREIPLTPIEYKILVRLMSAPDRLVSKDELIFFGIDHSKPMSYKALEMHISNLRKKSTRFEKVIQTKRGHGYYWKSH